MGRGDRVITQEMAKDYGVEGPSHHPDSHIPLSEWNSWTYWNKP